MALERLHLAAHRHPRPERKFTLQIALRSIVGAENIDWPLLLAASVMSILPLVLLFFVFQKYVMNEDIKCRTLKTDTAFWPP